MKKKKPNYNLKLLNFNTIIDHLDHRNMAFIDQNQNWLIIVQSKKIYMVQK